MASSLQFYKVTARVYPSVWYEFRLDKVQISVSLLIKIILIFMEYKIIEMFTFCKMYIYYSLIVFNRLQKGEVS